MSMLFDIVYATKANGTHHKLALDALRPLENEHAHDWQRLFLKHVDIYLEGAKAPDKEFKDFRNHVLHVGDEFWGGAPMKASIWYDKLVRALSDKQFEEAVYCAGVLSHYYTDPIQPFHTAQCEAENNMHRAVEWSINKSYKMLRKQGEKEYAGLAVEAGDSDDWVADMVRRGAIRSNQYYDALISNYNLDRGVVDPLAGLNKNCHRFLSELIIYAALGFSRILDKAILEASVAPPQVNLTLDTFVAGLGIPMRWVLRKLDDADQLRAVQAAYDELQQTGKVEKNLNEDDREVRALHKKEVIERRFIKKKDSADLKLVRPRKTIRPPKTDKLATLQPVAATDPESVSRTETKVMELDILKTVSMDNNPSEKPATQIPITKETERAPRFFLDLDDEIEKAPSIGRKTADRLEKIGIYKVADLLGSDPHEIAGQLDTKWIRGQIVRDWQDQSRLVCEVAGLRGGQSQILVAAGIKTSRSLSKMTAGELHSLMVLYCQTKEGKNLRSCENLPDRQKVEGWIRAIINHPRSVAA